MRALRRVVGLAAIGLLVAGCADPLFPRQADRTQYDQYDRLRGEYVPQYETDFYGQRRPALRERLSRY